MYLNLPHYSKHIKFLNELMAWIYEHIKTFIAILFIKLRILILITTCY